MQATIARHGHRLQYNAEELPNAPPDAFEVSLQGAWRLSLLAERRRSGEAMQALHSRTGTGGHACSLFNHHVRQHVPNSTLPRALGAHAIRSHLLREPLDF